MGTLFSFLSNSNYLAISENQLKIFNFVRPGYALDICQDGASEITPFLLLFIVINTGTFGRFT